MPGLSRVSRALIVHPNFVNTLSDPPVVFSTAGIRVQDLPLEILRLVCLQLDSCRDLCNFAVVSKEFRRVASDDLLWMPLCQLHFAVPDYASPDSWLELYKFNHATFKELFRKGWVEQMNSIDGPLQLPNHALVF